MRLCFGTFATILNHCRHNTTQAALIVKIVNIVDPKSRYCGEKMAGDGPAITKLLSCKIDFVFAEGTANILSLDTVIEHFETDISPFIDEDKKAKVIIALLDLIKNDNCIDSEKKESFIKYFGLKKQQLLQQSSFVFSDLLGRALLYTVCSNINNQVGKEFVKSITADYIGNVARPYLHELQWDVSQQTLTLLHAQMFQIFNQALINYQIIDFIENVDPSAIMNFKWVEVCNDFVDYTKNHIWIPFGQESISWTLQKIQQFAQTLDDYTNYLGYHMCPLAGSSQNFILQFRDEQPKLALQFLEKTKSYRQQLIDIYQEIYKHMLYA